MVELLSLTVYTFTFICTHEFVFKSEIRLKSPKSQNSMSSSRKHELVFKSEIRLKAREAKFEVFEPKGEPKSQNSRSSKRRSSRFFSGRRASLRLEDLEFWLLRKAGIRGIRAEGRAFGLKTSNFGFSGFLTVFLT